MDRLNMNEIQEVENIKKENKRFKIDGTSRASWAFRKIRALKKQANETNQLADEEIENINNWREKENKEVQDSISFFERLLIEYFTKEREENPKFRLNTPYGKVSTRKRQPKYTYDEEKLISYLENYKPELVKIKKQVNKTDFKNAVKKRDGFIATKDGKVVSSETGEFIEGITIQEQSESISVKVVE